MNFEERKRQAKGPDVAEAFDIMARELFDYANGCGWPTEKLLIGHLHEVAHEHYREPAEDDALKVIQRNLFGEPDFINKPPHYNEFSFQPIDIIAEVANAYEGSTAFHVGTALKYLFRAPFKGKLLEDLKKAAYYINRAIEEMEEAN